jgi:elongation factor P
MNRSVFGDDVEYLKPNLKIKLLKYGDEIIDYELPITVDYKVTDAEMAVAGDTANNPTKRVTVESGLEVRVPMFVNVGDTIRVKTEDGSYVTRV